MLKLGVTQVKPGLHISRKDRKHMFATRFLSFSRMPWSSHSRNDCRYLYFARNICSRYIDSFKLFLEDNRKHVRLLLQLYGDQALKESFIMRP